MRAFNRKVNGNYYKYNLVYDRGMNLYFCRSTGRRQAFSCKKEYPWKGITVTRKFNEYY